MKKFGIDISHWQGNFDFNKAIAEGVEFAIIKGGGGDDGLYTDSKFVHNYIEAKKKGLPVGCYWFSRARNVSEAITEAEYFYNNVIKGRQFELPVYIDVEHRDMLAVGKDNLTAIVKSFCEKLEAYGCFVGIYSSKSFFESYMNDAELQQYAHWVAQWAKNCSYKGNENVLGMWQFGGETNLIRTNKVAGVTCDQNYMLVDYPSLIKTAGLNGFKKAIVEEVEPVIKSTAELVEEVIAGKWGNGVDRKNKLTAAGYDYAIIQNAVNTKMAAKNTEIKVGDKVKISKDAVIYGTNSKFAKFVYNSTLYVRDINGARVVISTVSVGDVTGVVDKKYLTKI